MCFHCSFFMVPFNLVLQPSKLFTFCPHIDKILGIEGHSQRNTMMGKIMKHLFASNFTIVAINFVIVFTHLPHQHNIALPCFKDIATRMNVASMHYVKFGIFLPLKSTNEEGAAALEDGTLIHLFVLCVLTDCSDGLTLRFTSVITFYMVSIVCMLKTPCSTKLISCIPEQLQIVPGLTHWETSCHSKCQGFTIHLSH